MLSEERVRLALRRTCLCSRTGSIRGLKRACSCLQKSRFRVLGRACSSCQKSCVHVLSGACSCSQKTSIREFRRACSSWSRESSIPAAFSQANCIRVLKRVCPFSQKSCICALGRPCSCSWTSSRACPSWSQKSVSVLPGEFHSGLGPSSLSKEKKQKRWRRCCLLPRDRELLPFAMFGNHSSVFCCQHLVIATAICFPHEQGVATTAATRFWFLVQKHEHRLFSSQAKTDVSSRRQRSSSLQNNRGIF